MARGRLLAVSALVLLAACAALRHSPATRYQGILLDVREFGADEFARVMGQDPAVRAYVAAHGRPDFLVVPDAADVELIYYLPSVLAQFHRPAPDAPSVLGSLSPLPDGVLNLLPRDIRAGTPTPDPDNPISNCWTVAVGTTSCRTCCSGDLACINRCQAPKAP